MVKKETLNNLNDVQSKNYKMNFGGVDGARGGWVLTSFIDGKYDMKVHKTIDELVNENPNMDRIFIDIPIGLSSETYKRTIESKLRAELPGRASTVFNVPCRSAVYEENDAKAKKLNIDVEDKSLSIQSLSIRNKIKEVDEFILNSSGNITFIESHPEFCFKKLNQNVVLQSKKKSPSGINDRLSIIGNYDMNLIDMYFNKLKEIPRSLANKDDLIDSICLCLTNKMADDNNLFFLEDDINIDEKGIEIRIGYFRNE